MPIAIGESLMPAVIGSSPCAPWKKKTKTKSSAKRDSPLMNAAAVAAENSRLRKIVRSSIGARARCSIRTKAGSSTTEATNGQITIGSFQPERPPFEIP